MNDDQEKKEELHQVVSPQEENNIEEDFKEKYFRLLAEMENARKRLQKEKQDMIRFAVENVLMEVLTPLDTFESALGFAAKMGQETASFARGFEMILMQFKEILSNHNISSFHAVGEMFDPHKHEAVELCDEGGHADGTIVYEFLKGYRSGNRILRASRVKVAKTAKIEQIEEIKE